MDINLDVKNNSYDHLINFIDTYSVSNLNGTMYVNSYYYQLKFKAAFVDLVHAYELLLKAVLFDINENLIYTNIESTNIEGSNTLKIENSFARIKNFSDYKFEEKEKKFVKSCSKTRNDIIHFKFNSRTEKLKNDSMQLLYYYDKIHGYFFKDNLDLSFLKDIKIETTLKFKYREILQKNKNVIQFHGVEIPKENLKYVLELLKDSQNYSLVTNHNGETAKRIIFGEENKKYEENSLDDYISSLFEADFCPDCTIELGKFHAEHCDLEVCPFCFGQLLSCECNVNYILKTE